MDGYLGTIMVFAGNYAPKNWAYCYGQLANIAQNQALYSILGINYGGDGRTTFGIPDLRGRVVVGTGTGPGLTPVPLSYMSGFERVPIAISNLPAHNHDAAATIQGLLPVTGAIQAIMNINDSDSDGGETGNDKFLGHSTSGDLYANSSNGSTLNTGAITVSTSGMSVNTAGATVIATTANTGGSIPLYNMQPFTGLNYIICIDGLYPSRS